MAVNLLNLTDSSSNQGLSSASAVLVYDPTVFSVADADVTPGSLLTNPPPSGTWSFSVTATGTPGEVFINAVSSNTAANVTSTTGGLFANVNFHVGATAPTGTSTIRVATPTNLVPGKSDASNAIAANTSAAYTLNDAEQVNAQVTITSATHFSISATPTTLTAGQSVNLTVVALTAGNTTATGYTGTVHFTSSDSHALLPGDITLTKGVGTFTVGFNTAGTPTITATDTATPSLTGTSNPITVNAAVRFTISAPPTATAGTAFTIPVTALDVFGNVATDYSGAVHFTSSDGSAVLPADAALTNGNGTFTIILKTAGSQTLTASDSATPSITGDSSAIAVSPAAASRFVLSVPTTTTAGTPFTVTVTAQDAFGNTVTDYPGTVHFSTNDLQAVLPADATLTNGVGTFSITLKTAGTVSLTVTDTGNGAVTDSASVSVSAATLPAQRAVLTQLYQGLLGRALDPTGETVWMNAFSQGASQEDVANAIMASAEYRTKVVQDLYQAILGRTADA
ncbi:MAG TPA: DUF4214 domain-containing protein, partial [Gemmataceae bacterium]|nr:DUF4214 domain-containing protein [Gemmataceae bacterium]